jgi:hypothetical protein
VNGSRRPAGTDRAAGAPDHGGPSADSATGAPAGRDPGGSGPASSGPASGVLASGVPAGGGDRAGDPGAGSAPARGVPASGGDPAGDPGAGSAPASGVPAGGGDRAGDPGAGGAPARGALASGGDLPGGARERLGEAQARLVQSLVGGGAVPDGFAADRVAATADALLRKRVRELASTWPGLALGLGPAFPGTAAEILAGRPPAGALTDGWLVARALAARGALPRDGLTELIAVEATHRLRDGRLRPLRGTGIRVTRAAASLAVAVRIRGRVRSVILPRP